MRIEPTHRVYDVVLPSADKFLVGIDKTEDERDLFLGSVFTLWR